MRVLFRVLEVNVIDSDLDTWYRSKWTSIVSTRDLYKIIKFYVAGIN